MRISAKNKICIIIGDPVEHSLSPAMHNAAYKALNIDDQYIFVGARVNVENVKDVIKAVRVMNIQGLTCTVPHKVEVIKYLDWIDPIAQKIGAVNTVVNDNGVIRGYNTDWLGVIKPLANLYEIDSRSKFLEGKKVAVIGAGGAARAMVFGVKDKGAKIKIFNIDLNQAEELAIQAECDYSDLDNLEEVFGFDIVMNATPLGMQGKFEGQSVLDKKYIKHEHVVFDAVYIPYETQLLKDANEKGAKIIHGIDMLLHQGIAQFEYYTGHKAPEDVMRKSLLQHFKIEL